MKVNNIALLIVVLIVGAGIGFFGGQKYSQPSRAQLTQGNFQGGFGGRLRQGGNGAGIRPVVGSIISADNNSITVKMADGSSKIVVISDSTIISKTDTGSKSDLKSGDNVAVFGTTSSDGSVTAQNIQLNPMFRMGNPRPSAQ